MKTANFLLKQVKSIKDLLKHLERYPRLNYKGDIIEYSSKTDVVLIFKYPGENRLHMIGLPVGSNKIEWGMNFYNNRFVYTSGGNSRVYFYED